LTAINLHQLRRCFCRDTDDRQGIERRHRYLSEASPRGLGCRAEPAGKSTHQAKAIHQENGIMSQRIRACLGTLALIIGTNYAAAQSSQQEKLNLSPTKEQAVTQGLANEPARNVPGFSGQVGSKAPASERGKPLPGNVQAEVPEAKQMLFIKLDDRIVLIDPDTQVVAEIIMTPVTTGAGAGSSSSTPPGPGTSSAPAPAPTR
jgi:hypothetical protein